MTIGLKVLSWFSLSSIFVSGLYLETKYGVFFFSYVWMLVAYVLAIVRTSSFGIRKEYLLFFSILAGASYFGFLVSTWDYGVSYGRFASINIKIVMLAFFVFFFTVIYNVCGRSVKVLFQRYLEVAFFFAALGILQEIVFFVFGFDFLAPLSDGAKYYGSYIGIAGLSVEPAFYACALLPAGAYYISEFARRLKISFFAIVVVCAILLSTSSLGYIGLFISAVVTMLLNVKPRHILVIMLTLPLIGFGAYKVSQLHFVKMRMDDTMSVLKGAELTMTEGMNISTYSLAVNMSMSMRSVKDNYGLGVGFGSYSNVFDRYIVDYEMPSYRDDLPGRGSATSLFARLTAEIGVLAWVMFFICFLWGLRGILRGSFPAISIAYIATLVIILLRMGEYYVNGVVLAFLMIYFIRLEDRKQRKKNSTLMNPARKSGDHS